jgi:CRISPR-associated exonuclease Cas4
MEMGELAGPTLQRHVPLQGEPDYLPISMLNQLLYCERRFWLMYVCGEMEVNAPVLEGTYQHRRAHGGGSEREGDRVLHRRVYVWSDRLRIAGLADLVEEHGTEGRSALATTEQEAALPWFDDSEAAESVLVPVEYKRGKQGRWLNDQVQLCAQALCLEERTGRTVTRGEIFYWRSRRRVKVVFDQQLRGDTEAAVAGAFALLAAGRMPAPIDRAAKCRECSLEPVCLPREVALLAEGGR